MSILHRALWDKMLGNDEEIHYEFSIGRKYRMFKIYSFLLILLVSSSVLLVLFGFANIIVLAMIGVLVLFFLFELFYYGFYVPRANAYVLTNKRIIIHRGWLSTHTISIDYNKITDMSVAQSFFDRVVTDSGSIRINTAGTGEHEIILNHIQTPYEVKKKLDEFF